MSRRGTECGGDSLRGCMKRSDRAVAKRNGCELETLFTARECDVLALILLRATNRRIAEKLACSLKTVEFHVSNILRKTGVASRAELMRAVDDARNAGIDSALNARLCGALAELARERLQPPSQRVAGQPAASRLLTKREQTVLGLLRAGRSNKEIALELGCSVRTAEYHVANVLRKTNASRRLSLVGAQSNSDAPARTSP